MRTVADLDADPVADLRREESTGRVRGALLALFAAGLALDTSIGTWLGANGTHSFLSSLVLGLPLLVPAAWHFVAGGGGIRRTPASLVVMAGFVAWNAVSAIWASQPDDSAVVTTLTRAQLLAVLWMGHQLARSGRDLRALLAGYVVGCAAVAALTWRNFLMGHADVWDRYAADGFDPNDMSVYLALGIPMAGYLAGSARPGGGARLLFLLYVPAAASAIVVSGSRTGGIAAAVAICVLLVWLGLRRRAVAGAALVALAGGAALALPRIPATSWTRILSAADGATGGSALADRAGIWGAGMEVLPHHFLAGVGTGGFGDAVLSTTGERIVAHNTPLSVAVELGAVGLVLFFGAFALALRRARWAGRDARVLVWSAAATCLVGIQSLTWEHRKPLWFVLLVAMVVGDLRPARGRTVTPR